MVLYRKATAEDLERLWDYQIAQNPGDDCYLRWKKQFIDDNRAGRAATFAVVLDGEPVGEGTLLFSPECRAILGRTLLADGKTAANINALRIRKEYEGQGHISSLVRLMEDTAREMGYAALTIGVEEAEARNRAIYAHWGYVNLVMTEENDGTLVLYYEKRL